MGSLDKANIPLLTQAVIAQATPVQNTWYTVCDVRDIMLESINFAVATTNETLEVELTINGGTPVIPSQAAVAGTGYIVHIMPGWAPGFGGYIDTINTDIGRYSFPIQSLKVRIRKTTAAGAGTLSCSVFYLKY